MIRDVGRLAAAIAGIALIALPCAFIITFFLMPLWSWIEARFQIESVGHSGPAGWCFLVVYGVLLTSWLILALKRD